jgi:hypothetical protein
MKQKKGEKSRWEIGGRRTEEGEGKKKVNTRKNVLF